MRNRRYPFRIRAELTEIACLSCCKVLPRTTEFFYPNNGNGKLRRRCKECTNIESRKRHARPDANKRHVDRMREKTFGLTADEYKELVDYQDNKCAICGKYETRLNRIGEVRNLSVDHDHKNGDIRGLLCSNCNAGLGHFMDSPDVLSEAIRYLEEHHYAEQILAELRDNSIHRGEAPPTR